MLVLVQMYQIKGSITQYYSIFVGAKIFYFIFIYYFIGLRGFAKLKKFQKSKNNLEVGGSRSHLDNKKKLENRPKIKFCVCTIRPCLTVHVAPRDVHACSILSRIL